VSYNSIYLYDIFRDIYWTKLGMLNVRDVHMALLANVEVISNNGNANTAGNSP
jgi:hypothetical protein